MEKVKYLAEKPKRELHTDEKGSPSIKILVITLWLLFGFLEYIQAKEPLVLNDQKDSYDLSKHIRFLEDKNNQFNFKQILQSSALQKKFSPLPKGDTNFGLSLSTFWFKLELHNKDSKKEHYLLQLDKGWLDYITFFSKDNQKWEKIITGDRHPFKTRPIDHRTFLFPIKPGPKSVYY